MIMTEGRRRIVRAAAVALVTLLALSSACSSAGPQPTGDNVQSVSPPAVSPSTAASSIVARPPTGIDYAAMKRRLAQEIRDGAGPLVEVRAVLVSVDGRTELEFYQQRKPTEQAHIYSVTKTVISILVGIAVDEGRLQLDQTLSELLPEQVQVMTPEQRDITLEQLLTMTGGVTGSATGLDVKKGDPVEMILTYGMDSEPGTIFGYSGASAHLVATALRRAIDRPILGYAREKLFDPLGIVTRPAWEGSDRFAKGGFDDAGFAWLVDSTGVHGGGYGLRLTARDLVK
ncbi:MAG TPA: serine hydrolase, partial [Microlunatus sp.]|nr:serine hydrolase [Microlunatus sp.]